MSTQIDNRIGNAPRYYLWPQEDMNMRVPDEILKSVVFIGTNDEPEPVYRGTGFLVSTPGAYGDVSWIFLVTARHIAERLEGSDFVVRVNREGGAPEVLGGAYAKWWYHPTDASADVAVSPWGPPRKLKLDIRYLPLAMFVSDVVVKEKNIGIGDEVFITGLFTRVQRTARNIPIVRIGKIAMMPGERIPFLDGLLDAYLIESRSIGGLSGSPVFVRSTANLRGLTDGNHQPVSACITSNTFWLLGSMIGHWEVRPQDLLVQQEAVNMGISAMVPAQKIVEVLNHPELLEMRKQWDDDVIQKRGEGAVLDSDFPKSTQTTAKGLEIPVPTEGEFLGDLKTVTRRISPTDGEQ